MSAELNHKPKIAVIGGGVAGLCTAYLLREIGCEHARDCEILVLESQATAGGSTRTDILESYTCEWGPNGFLDNEPATLDLIERLDLRSHLVTADERSAKRYIYHTGKLREVPTTPPAFLTSDILSFNAKLRIALEFFVAAKRNGHDESVFDFGRRRLGKTFAEMLLDPMVSGIFAGNVHELSLAAVFPKMVEMESQYGGLFKALIAKQREAKKNGKVSGGPTGTGATLKTFKSGMGELTSTLAEKLKGSIALSSPVISVNKSENGFCIQTPQRAIQADAVVVACPSYAAAKIVEEFSPSAAKALRDIPYAPADVVCHGFPEHRIAHSLAGFGVLIPRSENIRSLGCLWSDSIFPGQSPSGHHLLRTIIGGAHDPTASTLSNNELESVALKDNAKLLGTQGKPSFTKIFRHPQGIAQYTIGHLNRVADLDKLETQSPGLFFTGASYRGVSVNGCVKDAFRVANRFWLLWEQHS